ncbi:glycosyltransferase family 4 protein [Parvibium lacunae]|uniref:Glycosyltransferase n=1 Tax=Parvibium lacunae TaxID=1888893 RepID=A0A368L4E3_9BURK|nr:glycosyltransferase family 4 protein [Parvibium lacunae]RCS58302.1 glycosyltransferase [Parvibium lacunae]
MRLLYVFPEPFPLPRARSVQVLHALNALADLDQVDIDFVSRVRDQEDLTEHTVFALAQARARLNWHSVSARWRGISIAPVSSRFFHANLGRWLRQQPQPYDCILVRHLKSVGPLKRLLPDVPLIYEAHEIFALTAPTHRQLAIGELERSALSLSDGVIANSAATARAIETRYHYQNPLVVLHNGVNLPAAMPEKDWTGPLRVTYAGSFFGWKGVDDLWHCLLGLTPKQLDTLPRLKVKLVGGEHSQIKSLAQALHDVQVLTAGSGEAIAEKSGIAGYLPNGVHVTLLPRQPASIVYQILQDTHIAVLPNRPQIESQFTSPIKLFEYMAAGCTLLASDLPAIREVVDERCAAFFAAGSPQSLTLNLLRLLKNLPMARELAEHGWQRVQAYSWAARAQQQYDFFKQLGKQP